MGKNYIESSLKRFLKKRVRITLGLVVTFLITGAVAFAEGTAETEKEDVFAEHNKNFIAAEENLAGIGTNVLEIEKKTYENKSGNGNQKITVSDDNGNIKLTFEGFLRDGAGNPTVIIDNKNISNITKFVIETSFNNAITALEKGEINLNSLKNESIINKGNTVGKSGGENNGLILAQYGMNNNGINNGIIVFSTAGMYSGNVVNNGLLIGSTGEGQRANNNLQAINNGIIFSPRGQVSNEVGGKVNANIFNYGLINVTSEGQSLNGSVSSVAENYGKIIAVTGQRIISYNSENVGIDNTINNYGIIEVTGNGQLIAHHDSGYTKDATSNNYGVIKTNNNGYTISVANDSTVTDEKLRNKGFNYGTAIVDVNGATITADNQVKVFEGDVTNKGIVILDNYTGSDLTNVALGANSADDKGLIFKRENNNYTVLNTDKTADYSGGKKEITNTFTDKKSTAYVTGTENKITENLSDKVIGTVVTNDMKEGEAVLKSDKDLVLENTVITGYFEKSGTLLDVGENNLTLLGDTKLVASRDDFTTDAVALNIDGTLKMIGDAEVAGKITGDGKIQQVATNGEDENGQNVGIIDIAGVLLQNATEQEEKYLAEGDNYTNITFSDLTTEKVTLDFDRTSEGKENTVKFTDALLIKGRIDEETGRTVAIDGTSTENAENNINLEFATLDSKKVQGDIILGATNDDIVVNANGEYEHTVDMGAGDDSFTVNDFAQNTTKVTDNHKERGTFDYKLEGVETIVLKGGKGNNKGWHIGSSASVSGVDEATLKIDGSELHVEMNNNYGAGNVTTSLDNFAKGDTELKVTTENEGVVKFTVGDKFDISQKEFTVATNYDIEKADISSAVIFKAEKVNDKDVKITLKEGSELGFTGYKELVYNAVLSGLSKDEELRNAVNYQNSYYLGQMINKAVNNIEAFYTTGYAVTKDVADTYMSVADDFGRKAGAGEWIAYGKYVNSDTEFDGGKASKGYDGDITGTVGMIEYGVNDTTSYGVIYGQGDTEVNINDGGKLEGDNTYFGGYVKHRTQKGIDITGNIGITKSELDLNLATNIQQGGVNHQIITDGKSDADALTFALRGTKDYKLSDSVKVQPVVSAKYSFITQDEVTSSDANFKMEEQDVTIFEGSFGGNVIKDFELSYGTLSLSAGAEYVLTNVNTDENARYSLYSEDLHFTGEEDIADNRIEGHIGAEYIHENGVGFNAKYEMIWTNEGDTDRVTAGVSYRF